MAEPAVATPEKSAPASLPAIRREGLSWRAGAGALALLAVALLLRAWGLRWGVPHADRYYPYHPDEPVLLHWVCRVNPLWGDVTPGFYNYGSGFVLMTRLAFDLLAPLVGWGTVPRFQEPFARWVDDFARLMLVGRWLSVLMGVGTVALTAWLGRPLVGARAGWLAAAFLAVAPMAVVMSHYMTVDVPATFWTTLALALAARALAEPGGGTGWIGAAGLAAGLAAGTKYSVLPVLLAVGVPIARLACRPGGGRRALAAALLVGLGFAVGFVLFTPGAILEPGRFRQDLLYELGRNREGQGLVFRATPPAFLYHLGISLPVGLEWPLYLLGLAGAGRALWRRRPGDALLGIFLLAYFLALLPSERKFVRYVMPMLPPLTVLAGALASELLDGRRRALGIAAVPLAGGAALAATIAHLGVLGAPDARDRAAAWVRERSRPRESVALASDPWYYTPPLDPTAGCVKNSLLYGGPPIWEVLDPYGGGPAIATLGRLVVVAPRSLPPRGALPVRWLRALRPHRVMISDYEYEDPLRVRRADPAFRSGILDLLRELERDYQLEREFRPRPSLAGFTWWKRGIPPHDWRYFMPTLRVYRRRESAPEPPATRP